MIIPSDSLDIFPMAYLVQRRGSRWFSRPANYLSPSSSRLHPPIPRKLYGLYPRKGTLIPGVSDADIVIWYPDSQRPNIRLTNNLLHHATDYTPYEGRKIGSWPRYTVLRGKIVWDIDNGGIVGSKDYGMSIKRQEGCLHCIWDEVEEEGKFDVSTL